jgi:excisionase family DNA binding protein
MTIDAALAAVVADAVAPLVAEQRRQNELLERLLQASPPRLVTVPEAARMLGVSPASAWRRVQSGELRVQRIGRSVRISVEDLRAPSRESIAEAARQARAGR